MATEALYYIKNSPNQWLVMSDVFSPHSWTKTEYNADRYPLKTVMALIDMLKERGEVNVFAAKAW